MARAKSARGRTGTVVTLTGPVTMSEVPRHREALLAAIQSGGDLRLDLAAAGPWDLAGLQLVLSAIKTVRQAKRRISLDGATDEFQAVAEKAAAIDCLDGVAAGIAAGPRDPASPAPWPKTAS